MTAVYKAINVAREMAETGIKKEVKNQQQSLCSESWRGITPNPCPCSS